MNCRKWNAVRIINCGNNNKQTECLVRRGMDPHTNPASRLHFANKTGHRAKRKQKQHHTERGQEREREGKRNKTGRRTHPECNENILTVRHDVRISGGGEAKRRLCARFWCPIRNWDWELDWEKSQLEARLEKCTGVRWETLATKLETIKGSKRSVACDKQLVLSAPLSVSLICVTVENYFA